MGRPGMIARTLMIPALVLLSLLGTSTGEAAAQGPAATDDSYVSELSDLEIAVAGDFTISETEMQEYEDGEGEVVSIDSSTALMQVAFYDDTDEPEETVELLNDAFSSEMDSFELLDEGLDGDRAWSFAQSELDNEEYFLYVDVTPDVVGNVDVMVMLAAPAATFFADLEAAQQDVTVDDEGVFMDVDVADLEDIAPEGAAGGDDDTGEDDPDTDASDDTTEEDSAADSGDDTSEEEPTAEADDGSTEEDSRAGDNEDSTTEEDDSGATEEDDTSATAGDDDDRRSGARLPVNDRTEEADELEDENQSETGSDGDQTGGAGFEDAGLVSDTEYVSPQFDIPVEWGDQWFVDYGDEESVLSDPASGADSLMLIWGGDAFALMFVDFSAAEDVAPADLVEYWISDEYREENADPDVEILLDDSSRSGGAVLTRDYLSEGDEVIILKEAVLVGDGETLAVVTLISTPDMYGEIYGDAEGDVDVDGEPAVSVFTQDDIEAAIEE